MPTPNAQLNSVRPILFLTVRSLINGVKRALGNPRRLIGLLFFLGYWILFMIRPFEGRNSATFGRGPTPIIEFPLDQIRVGAFALFLFLSVMLSLGTLSYRGLFRPADVDVMFPTPLSPRVVLLGRILRDYFFTLVFPLFFYLIGWRGAVQGTEFLFKNAPEHAGQLLRFSMAAWLLLALAWVCIGYATSLFVFRSDTSSNRNRWMVVALIALPAIAFAIQLSMALRADASWESAKAVLEAPWTKVAFFPAAAAWALASAPLTGNWGQAALGMGGMVGIIAIGLACALRQVDWMYDQAASRSADGDTMRDLQRKGDTLGLLAQHAKRGSLKRGRISQRVARLTTRGAPTLLWKEAILQARGAMWLNIVFGGIFAAMAAMFAFSLKHREQILSPMFLFLQGMLVFTSTLAGAQTGYIELLRRVDLLKPLPFSPSKTVFWEVAAKAAPTSIGAAVSGLVAVCLAPVLWDEALASLFLAPSASILISSVILLVTILFPDTDDPTQRGLRGLLSMIGVVLTAGPGVAILITTIAFKLTPLYAVVPVLLLNAAVTFGVSALAGNFYASYNPSE